jgi:hypothetical protein
VRRESEATGPLDPLHEIAVEEWLRSREQITVARRGGSISCVFAKSAGPVKAARRRRKKNADFFHVEAQHYARFHLFIIDTFLEPIIKCPVLPAGQISRIFVRIMRGAVGFAPGFIFPCSSTESHPEFAI